MKAGDKVVVFERFLGTVVRDPGPQDAAALVKWRSRTIGGPGGTRYRAMVELAYLRPVTPEQAAQFKGE